MKKLLASIVISILAISTFAFTTYAEDDNADSITIFESVDNLQNLKSYKINQGFSGRFKIDLGTDDFEAINGNYSLRINSDIINKGPLQNDIHSKLKVRVGIQAKGNDKPFDNLLIQLHVETMFINGDGLYARLNHINLVADGVPENELDNYNNIKNQMEKEVSPFKGQWIYFPDTFLEEGNSLKLIPEEFGELLDEDALKENLEEKGLKGTYEELIKEMLRTLKEDEDITDEQFAQFNNVANTFFGAEFFSKRMVKSGPDKGLTMFILSKRRVLQFIKTLAEELEENITERELTGIKEMLSKFYFSGKYRINNTYKIFDKFKIKFTLRDIEELTQLNINYFYTVSRINKIESIQEPDEFSSYRESLPFLEPFLEGSFEDEDYEYESEEPIEWEE